QRNMRTLVQRSDANRELFAAFGAMVPARTHRLAAKPLNGLKLPAKRAYRAIRPTGPFKKFAGLIFVPEGRICEVAHVPISQLQREHCTKNPFSQVYNCPNGDRTHRSKTGASSPRRRPTEAPAIFRLKTGATGGHCPNSEPFVLI